MVETAVHLESSLDGVDVEAFEGVHGGAGDAVAGIEDDLTRREGWNDDATSST